MVVYSLLKIARRHPPLDRRILRFAQVGWLMVAALVLAGCSGTAPGPTSDPVADLEAALAGRKLQPTEPYWSYRQAILHEAAGRAELAHAHLDSALSLDGEYAPAIALRSKLLFDEGRHQPAISLLTDYRDRHPEADDALCAALALHLDAVGAWEESDAVLATCSENSPPVTAVRTFLGLRGEHPVAATAAAEKALQADPESAVNLNNHGIALLYAGRPVEAKQAFLAALERKSDLPGALYNLAIVDTYYFYDEDAGREWFSRYSALASDDPDNLATTLGGTVATAVREEK